VSDVYEHNPGDHEDPQAGPTLLVGIVGTLMLVAILLALTAIYYNAKAREVEVQVVDVDRAEVRDLYEGQRALLHESGRKPREVLGETVEVDVIPIERAMALVVQEANGPR